MTLIGIAIFTIYTQSAVACDPKWELSMSCAISGHMEDGRYEPVYVGEFRSVEACDAAVKSAHYRPKAGERVEDWTQVLCVPKVATGLKK